MSALEFGAKAKSLRALSESGLPVPDAFYLPTSAYRAHALAAGVPDLLAASSAPLDPTPIADAMVAQPVAGDTATCLRSWFADLGDGPVAVRSSGNAEDLPHASFAGQHGTYFVHTAEELIARVRDCWASLYSERAVRYRENAGISHAEVEMGVIVQRLVDAKAAGVAFTRDPVSGVREIKVEACLGIGESLVSGKVTPDRFTISRGGGDITAREAGDKRVSIAIQPDGSVAETSVPPDQARGLCVDDMVVLDAARLALQAEDLFGVPVDIEWAWDGETTWLLQGREITTSPREADVEQVIWSNVNTGEILPDVITPFTWSVIHGHANQIFGGMFGALGLEIDAQKVIGLVGGRVYFNVSMLRESFATIPMLDVDRMLGGMHEYVELPKIDEVVASRAQRRAAIRRAARSLPRYVIGHRPRKARRYAKRLRAENEVARSRLSEELTAQQAEELLKAQIAKFEQYSEVLAYMAVAMLGFSVLAALCDRWIGDASGAIANKLVAGRRDVASAEAGIALWGLAVRARADEGVRDLITGPHHWLSLHRELEASDAGREFLRAWDAFMTEHGHHRRGELEFYNPTWAELPDYVLDIVRSYVQRSESDDPLTPYSSRSVEADVTATKCRQELRNLFKRWAFERALGWGRASAGARENLKNEAVRWFATIRGVLLVLGAQLTAERILGEPEDVFFLTYDEIDALMSDRTIDHGSLIVRRRAEYDHNAALTPPPVVVGAWDEQSNGLKVPADTSVLKGISVSAGVARGPARVFLSTDDEQQVLAGEILVAPFTDPGWTPYFVPAAGIVMDMGGTLSHGSIIAREYGIPAVVNVGPATRIITTGQLIEVDGDHGLVRVLENE